MGIIAIVAYRPKAGREAELLEVVGGHVPILRGEGLATERPPVFMRAADGTIVEVFEWSSQESIDRAHGNPVVQAMWGRFWEVCTCEPLAGLAEAASMFAGFEAID